MKLSLRVLNLLVCCAALLALVLASASLASPLDQTRGGNLKRRQYQTYATVTLYVDPTGSNSNACTASGTSACLTLAGALAKLPRFLENNVTINVAAGAYATAFPTLPNLYIGSGVTLAITGTMSAFSPATGTASGTTTAAAAGSTSSPPTITDSGQAWTVNNLKGAFVSFTSGTLNGQTFPIGSNTATAITFAGSTSAGVGATYSIVTPGSTFNSTSQSTIAGYDGPGTITVSNIQISRTGATAILCQAPILTLFTFTNCDIRGSTSVGFSVGAGLMRLSGSYVQGASIAVSVSTTSLKGPSSTIVVTSVLIGGTSAAFNTTTSSGTQNSLTQVIAESAAATLPVVSMTVATGPQNSSVWITCTGGAGSIGFGGPTISSTVSAAQSTFTLATLRVTGCETGIRVGAGMSAVLSTAAFDTVTTAISTIKGGVIDFVAGTPTFTTVTNELSQDGTAYTFATLTGLPAPQVITNSYGSRFIR